MSQDSDGTSSELATTACKQCNRFAKTFAAMRDELDPDFFVHVLETIDARITEASNRYSRFVTATWLLSAGYIFLALGDIDNEIDVVGVSVPPELAIKGIPVIAAYLSFVAALNIASATRRRHAYGGMLLLSRPNAGQALLHERLWADPPHEPVYPKPRSSHSDTSRLTERRAAVSVVVALIGKQLFTLLTTVAILTAIIHNVLRFGLDVVTVVASLLAAAYAIGRWIIAGTYARASFKDRTEAWQALMTME